MHCRRLYQTSFTETIMADVHTQEIRSYNMSRIRSKDTKPEMIIRSYLFSNGFRYRLHDKKLPGTPDLVLPKYKAVVFVHGCFWHGHEGCKYFVLPKTRSAWWAEKIQKNKIKDVVAIGKLLDAGWQVIEIWECQLKTTLRESTLLSLKAAVLAKSSQ